MNVTLRSTHLPKACHGFLRSFLLAISPPVFKGVDGPVGVLNPLVLHHHSLSAQHLERKSSVKIRG